MFCMQLQLTSLPSSAQWSTTECCCCTQHSIFNYTFLESAPLNSAQWNHHWLYSEGDSSKPHNISGFYYSYLLHCELTVSIHSLQLFGCCKDYNWDWSIQPQSFSADKRGL